MNIAIIGASSGLGLETVKQALAKGHQVNTLSRNTATLPEHPNLIKLSGTATSVNDLKQVISGTNTIIITIGKSKDKAPTLFPDTARALIKATDELRINVPVIVITGFGAGNSLAYSNSLFIKLVTGVLLKEEYAWKTKMEQLLAASNLQWEVVRPGMLTNGPLTKIYKAIPKIYKGIKVKKISRADVADFMLNQAEEPTLLYNYVTLTR